MAEQKTDRIAVFVEPTPNPNSLKFMVGRQLTDGASYEFASAAEAEGSPLAARIFEIAGVEGVFIGSNFVTVRKFADSAWDDIEPRAVELIEDAASSGEDVVDTKKAAATVHASDAEATIRKILDDEIRPAVAYDGGDIVFRKFEDGILTLKLVGACSGCPSSLMTLRMGIERRLKEDVADLVEVVAEA